MKKPTDYIDDSHIGDPIDEAQRLYEQGRELWRQGRRGEAMTAYAKAADLDKNSPAVQALEMAHEVMNFYNPDQFNP
jgi:Flp pilus assembly protein TadD